jgi:hypothetical protein
MRGPLSRRAPWRPPPATCETGDKRSRAWPISHTRWRAQVTACSLTTKLSGRSPAPKRRRERKITLALAAPGTAFHGPLQRKLGIACLTDYPSRSPAKPATPNLARKNQNLPEELARRQLPRGFPEPQIEALRNEATPCCLERRKLEPKKAWVAARYVPADCAERNRCRKTTDAASLFSEWQCAAIPND